MNYIQAKEYIATRRNLELSSAEKKYREILASDKKLYDCEMNIRTLIMKLAPDDEIEKAKNERNAILSALGYSYKDIFPLPHCPACGDKGITPDGKYCECVKRLSLSSNGMSADSNFTFSKSKPEVFTGEDRRNAESAYYAARIFTEKFPETKKLFMVIQGAVGTGKTFLAGCIANEISGKGYSVAYLSAFSFMESCLKYHTTFTSDKSQFLSPLMDSDLLIIDDLGTEPEYKNVSVQYLYNVINERLTRKKHTIITTNLSDIQIENRYGERTASRLYDHELCLILPLSGKDLRK